MSIKKLSITGLRGFSEKTEIEFALPDNKNAGSGLTVLVGPNNSGKSTIIEAIHLLTINKNTIPSTSRSVKTNGNVIIEAEDIQGNKFSLQSTKNKGAFIERKFNNEIQEYWQNRLNTFILTTKRSFSSTFNNNSYQSRENYTSNIGNEEYRNENNVNHNFGGRLLNIYKNKSKFNDCLSKVVSPLPEWTIESSNGGNLYLEFSFNEIKHSSNGAGDGYINIFNIVDSLYDSTENNVILIDEPEISLHPDLQRKLFKLLVEYSKDKQIIVSTHSPYFVDWDVFTNNGKIIRLKKDIDTIRNYELSYSTKEEMKGILKDANNPHTLSLNANEIFFLNDCVVLTEGQEDVQCYKGIFKKYNFESRASFFGWGAGGAPKIRTILKILYELGYKKVFTILDNDKRDMAKELNEEFLEYEFYAIAADDVRNKVDEKMNKIIEEVKEMSLDEKEKGEILKLLEENAHNVEGLVISRKGYKINEKYDRDIKNLIESIERYFKSEIIVSDEKKEGNGENTEDITINQEQDSNYIEEHKAEMILNKYLDENNIHSFIEKRYPYLKFKIGSGGILSVVKIKRNLCYAIVEECLGVSEERSIVVNFHYKINIKKEKVKLVKKKIISNKLPTRN